MMTLNALRLIGEANRIYCFLEARKVEGFWHPYSSLTLEPKTSSHVVPPENAWKDQSDVVVVIASWTCSYPTVGSAKISAAPANQSARSLSRSLVRPEL